ncbi:MAG: arsenate reductase (glutaredoxin) [Pseudomonadota bacterium]|nr:arsenate reductase (glutaredoxin) [Pseudomonadota bacterium]
MTVTIYHNPRCSKSRTTLGLLEEQGVEPEIINYLETPPDAATLKKLLAMLGLSPRDILRKKEKEYRELGLADEGLSDNELIRAIIEHPRLMERPIVVKNGRAALGRPPESVLEIL